MCLVVIVMVNFTCQLGLAMGPRYVVKQYSGCFYEVVFLTDKIINWWTLSKAGYPP